MTPSNSPLGPLARAGVLCLVALAAGCDYLPSMKKGPATPTPSEERIVREAFEALKEKNLQRFEGTTITTADFIMRDNGLNDFHDQASYAGSVLKPQEVDQQSEDYFAVINASGERCIDFSSATFVSLGTAVRTDSFESGDGKKIPYNEWSIVIKTGGREIDTKDLSPRFKTVEWNGAHRILGLALGEPGT